MLNTYDVLSEYAKVIRDAHPGWRGDRIANAGAFLRRIVSDMPEDALALANDMERNADLICLEIGLSPGGVQRGIKVLRGQETDV